MGIPFSRAISPPSSTSSTAAIDSMSPVSSFTIPCEFIDIIDPEVEASGDTQPKSDDAAMVVMDVISLNISPPNHPVLDLCDHALGQTSLCSSSAEVNCAGLSNKSASSITSTQVTADRSRSKQAITSDSLVDNLAKISSSLNEGVDFSGGERVSPQSQPKSVPSSSPPSTESASPRTPRTPRTPASAPASPLKIPDMASLSNITLHSPSTHIIGTPFATNSTPYEYPFPVTASPAPGHNVVPLSSSSASTRPPSPPVSPSPFPIFATSSTLSDPTNTLALSLSMAIPSELPPPPPQIHPRMRMTPPPVPPGLMKKRRETLQMRRGSNDYSRQRFPHDILHHSSSETDLKAKSRPSHLENGLRISS